jgi:phenylalanyl-tRNA synthetase beta chain
MRVILSWLREMAPLAGDPAALAEAMSALGLTVEELDVVGTPVDGVVVAEVLELRRHPQADRIQLVDVDSGDGEALQICCGAFNMAVGDRVPLATLGTVMPGGLEIARRKLRGEWSNGMLCSPTELGLGQDAGGILILPPDLPLGAPVFDALGVTADVVFDLDLTRNRPDAYSHRGVARDVAAFTGVPFTDVVRAVQPEGAAVTTPVELVDPVGCARFTATVLTGVAVGPSAPWMAERLHRAGMRPINNVVDVSNYVML